MHKQITDRWSASTDRAESSYGQPVYVAAQCPHGEDVAHSLPEAIACGLLRDARAARGISQETAARQIGVARNSWARWEQGATQPEGLSVRALEQWLLKPAQQED